MDLCQFTLAYLQSDPQKNKTEGDLSPSIWMDRKAHRVERAVSASVLQMQSEHGPVIRSLWPVTGYQVALAL